MSQTTRTTNNTLFADLHPDNSSHTHPCDELDETLRHLRGLLIALINSTAEDTDQFTIPNEHLYNAISLASSLTRQAQEYTDAWMKDDCRFNNQITKIEDNLPGKDELWIQVKVSSNRPLFLGRKAYILKEMMKQIKPITIIDEAEEGEEITCCLTEATIRKGWTDIKINCLQEKKKTPLFENEIHFNTTKEEVE